MRKIMMAAAALLLLAGPALAGGLADKAAKLDAKAADRQASYNDAVAGGDAKDIAKEAARLADAQAKAAAAHAACGC